MCNQILVVAQLSGRQPNKEPTEYQPKWRIQEELEMSAGQGTLSAWVIMALLP
tara:strand:- start:59 stop:217 length:159 start_codon:yes stop_codon:yes gene_type:complete